LGYIWLTSPIAVFLLASGMAATSFALSLLVPRHPEAGNETLLARRGLPVAAPITTVIK
jgi:formate-dependent nitrite reductase membrane component NrfD